MKLGLGCWPLGSDAYGMIEESDASEILVYAQNSGIDFFDTSPTYGNGLSETRIGKYLPKFKDSIVSTKVGMLPHNGTEIAHDFSLSHIVRSLNESSRRLNLDSLPLVWLHSPPYESIKNNLTSLLRNVQTFVDVNSWGISLKSPSDIRWASEIYEWSYIQFNYSILDQRIKKYSPILHSRKFKTVARTPFNFGFLTRDFDVARVVNMKEHHLSRWSSAQLDSWRKSSLKLQVYAQDNNLHLDQLALRFILDSPEIDLVIPGATSKSDLERNLDTAKLPHLSSGIFNFLNSFEEQSVESSPYTFL